MSRYSWVSSDVIMSSDVQFPIICSLQYSIDNNTVEVNDPHTYLHSETQEYHQFYIDAEWEAGAVRGKGRTYIDSTFCICTI